MLLHRSAVRGGFAPLARRNTVGRGAPLHRTAVPLPMEAQSARRGTDDECQRKRESCNPSSSPEAEPAANKQRLVAESAGPFGAPHSLAPVQSDGGGFQLRRAFQVT